MEQELSELKSLVYNLTQKIDILENLSRVNSNYIETLVQSLNAQIMLLNQMSQSFNIVNNKLSDIEIRDVGSEDQIQDVITAQSSIERELREIKDSIEAIKFYAFNTNNNQF